MQKQNAFSLVELLAVIAILAILAALILTGLDAAKKRGRQTQCMNNLRQLGLGLNQFTADFHAYPLAVTPSYLSAAYPEHSTAWSTALDVAEFSGKSPFGENVTFDRGIWVCPSAHRPENFPAYIWSAGYGYNAYGIDDKTNVDLLGLGGQRRSDLSANPLAWSDTTPPVRESDVTNPSEMLAIADGFAGNNGIIKDAVWATLRRPNIEDFLGSTKRAILRHNGKSDVVFCDGHFESPTLNLLFDETGDSALSIWNRDHQPHRDRLGF